MKQNDTIMWIPVMTSNGMFSSEAAIKLTILGGDIVSFFADRILLRHHKGESQMRVHLVSKNKNSSLVLLPCETFETSSRWVEVPSKS